MATAVKVHGVDAPQGETASQAILKQAATTADATDTKGRKITVRRINALQLYRLTKVLGEAANNAASLNLAMSAASVSAIDGEAVDFPASEREIEATMGRLDFEGLTAASEALQKLGADTETDAAKNSAATPASA